jgi:nitroimidazol reductase NimA-like FMN-containing flavoprotein (pyridoxamine 5'-phosphate oxidase superfamily)
MLIDDGLELLSEDQCRALLGPAGVGRVGITIAGLPVIMPVNYVFVDGDVVFRTGDGTKLHAASNGAVIAFEVDAFDPAVHSGWSVLAIGRSETVSDPGEIDRLNGRAPSPWAGGERTHLVRLHPEMLTGRRIAPGPT